MKEITPETTLHERIEHLVENNQVSVKTVCLALHRYLSDVAVMHAGQAGAKTRTLRRLFGSLIDYVDGDNPIALEWSPEAADNTGRTGLLILKPGDVTDLRFNVPNTRGNLQMQIQDGDLTLLVSRDDRTDADLFVRVGQEVLYEEPGE